MVQIETFIEILMQFALLSLIIERSLYQVFDSKIWKDYIEKWIDNQIGRCFFDIKPFISICVSVSVIYRFKLDMIANLLGKPEQPTLLSMLITGFFVAGGSTGVYKFFKQLRKLKEAHFELEMMKNKAEAGELPCSENIDGENEK